MSTNVGSYPDQWGDGPEFLVMDADNVDVTPLVSTVIWLGRYRSGGGFLKTTGNVAGAWNLFGSWDWKPGQDSTTGTWYDHMLASGSPNLITADGVTPNNEPLIILNLAYKALKFVFTPTSGNGHLTVGFLAKF